MNNTIIFDDCSCNICIEYKLLNDSFKKIITKYVHQYRTVNLF